MHHTALQKAQLPGLQHLAAAMGADGDAAFDALDGDLARHLVRRHGVAGAQHQVHDFERVPVQQRRGLFARQPAATGLIAILMSALFAWVRVAAWRGGGARLQRGRWLGIE
jgi:hypothetical protein